MQMLIGLILIAIALSNDIFTVRLHWLRVVNGNAPSGIMLVPAVFYAIGAILIWPELWARGLVLIVVSAVAFHIVFIVVATLVVDRLARPR